MSKQSKPAQYQQADDWQHRPSAFEVLPGSERGIGNLVRRAAAVFGDRTFVHWRGAAFSYADIDRRANRVANAFRSLGVRTGSRVAILCHNRIEYLEIWFGLAKLGAIALPLNTAYKAPQILHTLSRAAVPVVVVQRDLAPEFELITERLNGCSYVVTLDGPVKGPGGARLADYHALVAGASDDEPDDVTVVGTDVGAIMNTSGTTGMAKGVLLPHGQQYWLGRNMAIALELGQDDVFYNFFPLFHNTAQAMITIPVLLTGGQMVLTEKFSLSSFWPDVHKYGITVFYYIGEILHLLVKSGTGHEAKGSRLRAAWGIAGAAKDIEQFERRYGVRLGAGYGSTEGNVPIFRPLGVDSETASAGKTLPEFEVRVVDAADRILPVGEVGEIVIRTAETGIMMAGYDGDDEATAKAMAGGWYHSGDAGRFDEWGNLFFVSRIKDVIRVRGENVSAFEIEDVLLSFPGVLEAAAIAVPCEMGGDEVKAVVVPGEGARIDVHALVAHCDRQLPKFSVPRYVEVRGALPKTVTNKIQKNVLRAEGLNRLTWDRTTGSFLTANAEEQRDNH
jgi:crotonobetaine/carnitine-CoA ligase